MSDLDKVFKPGVKYLVRTVAYYTLGEVVDVVDRFVIFKNASWVADTGRFHQCVASGKLMEVECYPPELSVSVHADSVCDACEWVHPLPTESK